MQIWYKNHSLKKSGQSAGGKFHGPSLKYILRDEVLSDLEDFLGDEAENFILI